MWTYKQTGQLLTPQGVPSAHVWYSGFGPHANIPADEGLAGLGPIPRGNYTMTELVTNTHMGPVAIHLEPDALTRARIITLKRGPDSFFMHDDTAIRNHTASEGCIVSESGTIPVMSVWDSTDHDLTVE